MDNYTAAPDDEYDVLIQGDLDSGKVDGAVAPELLSARQVLQFCCAVFAVGVLDNALAVYALVRFKGLKQVGDVCFLSLAVSNLCFLLPLPFWAHAAARGESPGHATCKVLVGLHSAGLYSQALLNTLLLVQGYLVFSQGSWASTLTTLPCAVVASVLAWVAAAALSLPEAVFYEPQMERQKHTCAFGKPHFLPVEEPFWKHALALKTNVLALVLPLLVLIFCCAQMRKAQSFRERWHDLRKPAFVLTAVFLLMWAPYSTVLFLSAFQEHLSLRGEKSSYHLAASIQVTQLIATTHCCVNPLLWLLLDQTFTRYLRGLFPRCSNVPFQSGGDPQAEPSQGHDSPIELYSSVHQRQDA